MLAEETIPEMGRRGGIPPMFSEECASGFVLFKLNTTENKCVQAPEKMGVAGGVFRMGRGVI